MRIKVTRIPNREGQDAADHNDWAVVCDAIKDIRNDSIKAKAKMVVDAAIVSGITTAELLRAIADRYSEE